MSGTIDLEKAFREVKASVKSDEKGRIVLGADYSGKNFRLSVNPETGDILLTPVVIIPERDMWLYRNPVALAEFQAGLADAAAGRVSGGVDFSQYADDEIEDE